MDTGEVIPDIQGGAKNRQRQTVSAYPSETVDHDDAAGGRGGQSFNFNKSNVNFFFTTLEFGRGPCGGGFEGTRRSVDSKAHTIRRFPGKLATRDT